MNNQKLALGILAHVDAGKTTLSEAMLYLSGHIRRLGRVDHGDAYLDTYELERARGITIFSKQAVFSLGDMEVTLLDTPGHVDFSAEMERTLAVLDYAVLVVGGADGVQSHTQTLWRLLRKYEIPAFLFVNKMDQAGPDREKLLGELKTRLFEGCVDFDPRQDRGTFYENLAVCSEELLEKYLDKGELGDDDIRRLILMGQAVPCYFGSALRLDGVEEFLAGLSRYAVPPVYGEDFGAKVFKISRDEQNNRLTHMKITGGSLKVRSTLSNRPEQNAKGSAPAFGRDIWEEKVNQIRLYSGDKFETVNEAGAGTICAVAGLSRTRPGQGLGAEAASEPPVLEPVLTYQIILPDGCDAHQMFAKLKILEEEEPQLHIAWFPELGEIHAQVMGAIQIEILKSVIAGRFGVEVEFGRGNIVYKETITGPVEGVGHFEPLRHYAEVHLLLEPGEPGSGLHFYADCGEDMLDAVWQRQILSALMEKEHRGVLTGSALTDTKITLIAGRAHVKHTEGGDFREAACRAVRQGLMRTGNTLLEPWYEFTLEVPANAAGRAMADVQRMSGTFSPPATEGDYAVIKGSAPVAEMREYPAGLAAYTKGMGRISLVYKGYEPCHNAEEVIAAVAYDAEADTDNPAGSIFCAHGAGFYVKWDEAESHMHIPAAWRPESRQTFSQPERLAAPQSVSASPAPFGQEDRELEEIFTRTYGPQKERRSFTRQRTSYDVAPQKSRKEDEEEQEEYLLVDGYNVIFAWEELRDLAKGNMMGARQRLMDILSNYQGYRKMTLIVVFDAYKVEGGPGNTSKYHNIHVVYTKEAETADQYIEKTVHQIGRKHNVTVATSDGAEQVIILGQGGRRLSAANLRDEILSAEREMRREHMDKGGRMGNYLLDYAKDETAENLEDIRLGRDQGV